MKFIDFTRGKVGAITIIVLFVLVAVSNYLVSNGTGVTVSNVQIANSNPVFVLPKGYAFSIWGVIYLLEGVFSIYQVLPSKWEDKQLDSIRPWVVLTSVTNVAWLFLFGCNVYWIAAINIFTYEAGLLKLLSVLNINYLDKSTPWQVKVCVVAGFSLNAAWVFVASLLQINVNLLNEGVVPTDDFGSGCLMLAVVVACYIVYMRCDIMYALGSAWALGGVIANQQPGTKWGMASDICTDACLKHMRVCQPGLSTVVGSPKGVFYDACMGYNATAVDGDSVVVATSQLVISACYVGIALVVLALVLGVINFFLPAKDNNDTPPQSQAPMMLQEA